jgi:FkbM family methyltransferase
MLAPRAKLAAQIFTVDHRMLTSLVNLNIDELPIALTMHVHGEQDRFVSQRLREEGIWEPYETALVLKSLAPGAVFVDVGANIGYFSLLAAAVVGASGSVFAFEPDTANVDLMRKSAAINGMSDLIHVVPAALSDKSGEGRLYLSEDNLGDHQVYAGDPARDSQAITLLNGSEYLTSRLQRLAMLKVDTQGAEYHVMVGLMPLLRELAGSPRLLIELTPFSLVEAGASGRDLIELLAELGQPMWIVDHIEHRLVASSPEELARWCDNVQATPGDQGFMNILVGPAPD